MRIVSGDYKGRRLFMPQDYNIRPTTEKVKEAIFSMIQFELQDSVCVDVFTGIGNLGLEALSRGAKLCYFCDNSRSSLALAKRNIELCKAESKSKLIPGDYTKTILSIPNKADIIFLDPPYQKGLLLDCFSKIKEADLLAEDGLIIAEHGKREDLPEEIEDYKKIKEKNYGSIAVSVYKHKLQA